jgi:hypothetical protein
MTHAAPEPYASRRELDQLREDLRRLDDHGSRGVGAIQIQLTALVRDMAELKIDTSSRFAEHFRQHEADAAQRRSDRWKAAAVVAALIGPLYPLLLLLHR